MPQPQIELELPARPEAPGIARQALEPLHGKISTVKMQDLQLLVSELVTNSVRHAGLPDPASVTLNVRLTEDRLRVEVTDTGPGFERPRRDVDPTALDGWGLFLVERLTDRWGVGGADSTCVWFEIDLPA